MVAASNSVVHAMSVKMSPFVGVGFRVSRRRRRQKEMNFRIMLLELFLGERERELFLGLGDKKNPFFNI